MRRIVSVDLLSILLVTTSASAAYVDSSGRVWRDLAETVGFSWVEINSLDRGLNGALVGSLESSVTGQVVDFTGWHWATLDEVDLLFFELGFPPDTVIENLDLPFDYPGTTEAVALLGNTEASDGIDDPVFDLATGWTSTMALGNAAYRPAIQDLNIPGQLTLEGLDLKQFDLVYEELVEGIGFASANIGVFLYTPIPAAVWLFGSALIGLVGFDKRRKAA